MSDFTVPADAPACLKAALQYAELGWAVIPLKPNGKTPLTKHSFKDASTDPAQILEWWARWPNANVGIATGARSGLLVLDVDSDAGLEVLKSLVKLHGVLPPPWVTHTARGKHFLFALPPGCDRIPCSADGGLDIRGDGGYIVAPPSAHPSGGTYRWADEGPTELPAAPSWLIDFARNRKGSSRTVNSIGEHVGKPQPMIARLLTSTAMTTAWSKAEEDRIASALQYLDPRPRETWLKAGFALHDLQRADPSWAGPARRLWDDWSRSSPEKFDEHGQEKAWASFDRDYAGSRTTIGSVFHSAQRAGWIDPLGLPAPAGERANASTLSDQVSQVEPHQNIDLKRYMRTEVGLSEIFRDMYGKDLRFVESYGSWLIWDGTRWVERSDRAVLVLAEQCIRQVLQLAAELPKADDAAAMVDTGGRSSDRSEWLRFAISMEREAKLRAIVNLAKGHLLIDPRELDKDAMLLGCPNGTVELRTGQLREACREDFITRQTAVPYNPETECPEWLKQLSWALAGDQEAVDYLQRWFGYCATGSVDEEMMLFCIGEGSNGKTSIMMTVHDVLGDYASKASPDLLVSTQGREGAASPDVAALHGKRFVLISELEDNAALNEARVKEVVSNASINARRLYGAPFEFKPSHKIGIDSNHMPWVRNTDEGIRRRVKVLTFSASVPAETKRTNFRREVLWPEAAGILAWIVRGTIERARRGLGSCIAVDRATAEQQDTMDTVKQFLGARVASDVDWRASRTRSSTAQAAGSTPAFIKVEDVHKKIRFSGLYEAYRRWCEEEHTRPMGKTRFSRELTRKGFRIDLGSGNCTYVYGLMTVTDAEKPDRASTRVLTFPHAGPAASSESC